MTTALSRLVSPQVVDFGGTIWGRRALLSTAADLNGGFADLLDEEAVDELVSRRGLRTPFLRVARSGSTLPEKSFTAGAGVGAGVADQVSDSALVRLFADGSTMVLQGLHRVWPPIIDFCQALAAELGHPVQANAYVTPPQNQGFDDHYDVHDVFVLQIAGQKQWSIHTPVYPAPLRDQPWTDRRQAVRERASEEPVIETVLFPGDCLYLPRGYLHAAKALGGVSTHLTIGVHVWTRYGLAEELTRLALEGMARDEAVRGSLPLGTSFTDSVSWSDDLDGVRERLAVAVRAVDRESIRDVLLARSRSSQRPEPVGPLAQLRAATAITDTDRLRLRHHLEPTLDGPVLRTRAGEVRLSEDDVVAVKALVADGTATAADLGADLTRRLLLAGLAIAE